MRHRLALAILLTLAACGSDPDQRSTPAENRVAAKAVADVDAALIDGRKQPVVIAAPAVEPAGPGTDAAPAVPATNQNR